MAINSVSGNSNIELVEFVRASEYAGLADDEATEELEDKYSEIIDYAYSELGVVSRKYNSSELSDVVAGLYLERGLERWGEDYDIVLGGGYIKTRSPYDLKSGSVRYADILSLLPFDNRLVLCSISGNYLMTRFVNTDNSDYHNAYSEYGMAVKDTLSSNETYYVVVDTYTALYKPNRLTIVDYYDEGVYARDLLADAVQEGRYQLNTDDYTLTSIKDALEIGAALADNQYTTEYHYIKGTVKSITNTTYGNLYIEDENGDEIYVYGVNDLDGNKYGYMSDPPKVGDVVLLYSTIYKYVNYGNTTIELKSAILLEKS